LVMVVHYWLQHQNRAWNCKYHCTARVTSWSKEGKVPSPKDWREQETARTRKHNVSFKLSFLLGICGFLQGFYSI
jgi:hypothetical protein